MAISLWTKDAAEMVGHGGLLVPDHAAQESIPLQARFVRVSCPGAQVLVVRGRSDHGVRIALRSETSDGEAGGEVELGHPDEPTDAASARSRHSEVAVQAHAATTA
jgi:hypothetical protein